MPRVVVTDFTFGDLAIEESILRPLGCSVEPHQCRSTESLLDVVREADYIITQFAPLNAQVVSVMEKARLIVRYGIGVDNVDLDATRQRGIPVCNVPDFCIDEVADHTLALILSATRRLASSDRLIRSGGWGLSVPLDQMRCLATLTVGIVGFGRIGRAVRRRLTGFGCSVLVSDPIASTEQVEQLEAKLVDLDELLSSSDVVTLHCPSTPETKRLLNASTIGRMKPGAILVNVARGDVVDGEALIAALKSGHLSAAMLDVTDPEPLPADNSLRSLDNVQMTPHIASASARAVRVLRESAAHEIARSIRGEPLKSVVNGVGGRTT